MVGSERRRLVTGSRCGKYCSIISVGRSIEISLNMLQISRAITHLLGGLVLISSLFLVIYFSISILIVWWIKLLPPLTPIA